ncbi:TDT family transporter [Streptomyces sp. NPDC001982]|uniref:SLAC1 family transporter n=1 Tax=unclassified Streptomyces TaxID=2593676 RepID=UPI00332E6655
MPRALPANLFGVCFGIAGLAEMWTTVHDLGGTARWPGAALWLMAGAAWLVTVLVYAKRLVARRAWRAELGHPVQGPFVSVAAIVVMLLGVALAGYQRPVGEGVYLVGLVLTVGFGAWITGQWITNDMRLVQWHPGYALPTVTGGLLGAAASASLGHRTLAYVMFGYGVLCWVLVGSILLLRLATQPALPDALLPTMAIEVAPPVVAGNAWLTLNGGSIDPLAAGLAGHAGFMVLLQIALIPLYRRAPFGPGYWAFAISYTTAVTLGIRWLSLEQVPGRHELTWLLVTLSTAAMVLLATCTVLALMRGTFLPRTSDTQPTSGAATGSEER